MLLHHAFGVLDPFGNFDLLLAGEKRDLPHLLEVHPHRVVKNVELRIRLFLVGKLLLGPRRRLLVAVHLGSVDDVDLQVAQEHDDRLKFLRIVHALRDCLVQVVPGQITLVLGQLDEVAQPFLPLRLPGPDRLHALRVLCRRVGDRLRGRVHPGLSLGHFAVLPRVDGAILVAVFLRLDRRGGHFVRGAGGWCGLAIFFG
jgi:hypothetical protein